MKKAVIYIDDNPPYWPSEDEKILLFAGTRTISIFPGDFKRISFVPDEPMEVHTINLYGSTDLCIDGPMIIKTLNAYGAFTLSGKDIIGRTAP